MRQHVIRNSRELGKVVRQRRKTLALTQAALAAVAGVGSVSDSCRNWSGVSKPQNFNVC